MKMGCNNFQCKYVKDLQQFLKKRNVIFSEQRKCHIDECVRTCNINLKVASGGLIEDKAYILNNNYWTGYFFHPWSMDLSVLSPVGIFDIYNYLI